jgi:23S rRNA pseudouridine2605 synthase
MVAAVRLAKYIAHAGVASRRGAEAIIRDGRVSVDGVVTVDPAVDVGGYEAVALDGRLLSGPQDLVVHVLNKPAGVVSTASDPQGRRTVIQLIDARGSRVYPVGRLDVDTTGLILLTNDGELANLLMHPRYEVEKTYRATVARGPVGARAIRALREGVVLDDGLSGPARVRLLAPDQLELIIHEGRKRQVRRMCEAVGHRVIALQRVAYGPLELGTLGVGEHRRLAESDVERLRAAAVAPG